jgi:putative ABC transport system permease protein
VLLVVLALGFNANDLKLLSAIILALAIMIPQIDHRLRIKRTLRNGVKANG